MMKTAVFNFKVQENINAFAGLAILVSNLNRFETDRTFVAVRSLVQAEVKIDTKLAHIHNKNRNMVLKNLSKHYARLFFEKYF